jgi:hypothetical protein
MSKPAKSASVPTTAQSLGDFGATRRRIVKSELILYQTEDNRTRIEVRLENETVWLTQKLMAELFQKDVRTINEHIQNIFEERELSPDSVIRKFRITAADGKSYETQHYNLDVKNPHTVSAAHRDPAELLAEYQNAQAAVAEVREKLRRELETALTR